MGPLGRIVYAPTDVGPLWYSRLVATPTLFTRLPRDTQDRIASRSIRPACSYFVKVRVDGIRLTTATPVTSRRAYGEGLRVCSCRTAPARVDHLMFGTGYEVDVGRYPFLGDGLRRASVWTTATPRLVAGSRASLHGLHIVGAPASRSFGPTMRFVSGSWYGGQRVAQAIARRRGAGLRIAA